MKKSLYWNRWLFYSLLTIVGGMMLIDAIPQTTMLHKILSDAVDPVLDKTGLWQGNWQLFAPSPDQVNVRVVAKITWDDQLETEWHQPEWYAMSPIEKTLNFRRMEYFDNLWMDRNGPAAWKAFCFFLSRELEAKERAKAAESLEPLNPEQQSNSDPKIIMIRLYQDRDLIPSPTEKFRKANSEPEYSKVIHLYTWFPNES